VKRGKTYLGAYLGVMGPQDGVDYALRAIAHLRRDLQRDDVHFVFMGSGDAFDEMVALAAELGVDDIAEFTGRVPEEFVQTCLSTADICLSPDPFNPLNDVSTMNKVVEYMAMGRPIVSFDLLEARVSAGEAAVYVKDNNEAEFARAIDELLDDPAERARMGAIGHERVERELSWDTSRKNLLAFYARVFSKRELSSR
jgi:glycosyltransferase involved in cell wall biosynthesis